MNTYAQQRARILQQMEQILTMERGSLQAETRPSKQAPEVANGPYFKHQVWADGRNQTRRVPRDEAGWLEQAIQGRQQFEALAEQFVSVTVAMTRAQPDRPGAKKNATSSRRSSTRKRRA